MLKPTKYQGNVENSCNLGPEVNRDKIQIIVEEPVEVIFNELSSYLRTMTKYSITYREQVLHIPKDFRTRRFTFYITVPTLKGTTEIAFMDVFNGGSFELIPFEKVQTYFIGSQYTLLRFLFIDLFIIRLIKELNLLDSDTLKKKLASLWDDITFVRDNKELAERNFGLNYIGIYHDYSVDKKIENSKAKVHYPYYPDLQLRKFNAYKTVDYVEKQNGHQHNNHNGHSGHHHHKEHNNQNRDHQHNQNNQNNQNNPKHHHYNSPYNKQQHHTKEEFMAKKNSI